MRARLLVSALLLVPGLAAGYMTWISWRAGDEGKWIFAAFTAVFVIPAIAALFPRPAPKPEPQTTGTRFAPHWALMLATLCLAIVILYAIGSALWRWLS